MVLKCDRCSATISGVSEEEWGKLFTENSNLRIAYLKLAQRYEKDTGRGYDLNAILGEAAPITKKEVLRSDRINIPDGRTPAADQVRGTVERGVDMLISRRLVDIICGKLKRDEDEPLPQIFGLTLNVKVVTNIGSEDPGDRTTTLSADVDLAFEI